MTSELPKDRLFETEYLDSGILNALNDDAKQSQAEVGEASKARHFLVLQNGHQEQIIPLDATTYSIGRHQANSIVIDDVIVSRQHAILLRIPKPKSNHFLFRIIDGNLQGKRSQNGIWVNGKRCYSHDLQNNDVILFSNKFEATYYQVGQIEDTVTPAQPSGYSDHTILMSAELKSPELKNLNESVLIRMSSIPELTPHPILELESDGTVIYLNSAAQKHFPGICDEQNHPIRLNLYRTIPAHTKNYCEVREIEVGDRVYEQSIHWIPQSNLIRCYCNDITQRRQMEEAVRKSEERFALAARGANDGLWDWDLENAVLYLSPRWKAMIGYEEHELYAHINEWLDRIHPEDQNQVHQAIDSHLKGLTAHLECEYRLQHKQGNYLFFRCRGMAIFNDTGKALRMAGSMTDVTEYHQAREKVLHDALHDSLTGLPNRLLLLDRISQALKSYQRNPQSLFALFFIDLDRFKVINDSLGHLVGDQLLIQVAQRLRDCTRDEDTVARLGGDEFVILIKDVGDFNGAIKPAIKIRESLRCVYRLDERDVFTSASIGIVLGDQRYEQPAELLRDADMAMYQAKRNGKDDYAIFDSSMYNHALKLLEIENSLRLAIDNQDFELYYQPIIDLKTKQIRAFEALIRWRHPEKGLISPAEFIPLAEDTGLIIPLGNWIIQEAFQQLQQWQQDFPRVPPISLCINISSRQFSQPDFVHILQQALERTSVPPESIELEMTEGAIMQKGESVIEKLYELKKIGFKLSIDDFGTGYSSLSYLQNFPVDTLKVDRSFVSKMENSDSYEIVKTIMTLAHNLKLATVAEGVEKPEQVQIIQAMNCEYAQGYHYSPPLNQAKATQMLDQMFREDRA